MKQQNTQLLEKKKCSIPLEDPYYDFQSFEELKDHENNQVLKIRDLLNPFVGGRPQPFTSQGHVFTTPKKGHHKLAEGSQLPGWQKIHPVATRHVEDGQVGHGLAASQIWCIHQKRHTKAIGRSLTVSQPNMTLPETNSEFTPKNGGPLEVWRNFYWKPPMFRCELLV